MHKFLKTNVLNQLHFPLQEIVKALQKKGLDISLLSEVLSLLVNTGSLPSKYRPHKLIGKYAGAWECHIQPDWLLIWQQDDIALTLLLIDSGTHSDIFG